VGVLWIFFFVIWVWLLVMVFTDVFRRHDIGGVAKTLWVIFMIVAPYLSAFIYLISQSREWQSARRPAKPSRWSRCASRSATASPTSREGLDRLHHAGALDDSGTSGWQGPGLSTAPVTLSGGSGR
jgi:hypothetical protein